MNQRVRVLSVFGTRPEAIKMAPVVHLLDRTDEIDSMVCVTAQHREMLDQVLDVFRLQPDRDLDLMRTGQDLFDLTARVVSGMKDILSSLKPDFLLVHGDTTTTFSSSLSAHYAKVPVGHVEAGLRTRDRYSPFPEEMNRRLTGSLAELHFAPTLGAMENLLAEGVSEDSVSVTGNTAVDALLWMTEELKNRSEPACPPLEGEFSGRRLVLITAHRRESFGEGFDRVCLALKDLCLKFPETLFVYPVHLNPNVQGPVNHHLSGIENMRLIEPLPYAPFVDLMRRSHLILTDSGGIQEEAPSLGVPVLVLRDQTERPEASAAGTALLVGTDREKIVLEASRLLDDSEAFSAMSGRLNPYGDGHASERIVNAILVRFGREPAYEVPPFAG